MVLRTPCRKCVYATWDVAGFTETQESPGDQEACPVLDEDLEGSYETEDEDLSRNPFSGTNLLSLVGVRVRGSKLWLSTYPLQNDV